MMFNGCGFAGKLFGCKFCGGIGLHGVKGKSQFSVLSVATDVNSTQQVGEGSSIFVARFLKKKSCFLVH